MSKEDLTLYILYFTLILSFIICALLFRAHQHPKIDMPLPAKQSDMKTPSGLTVPCPSNEDCKG